MSKSFTDQLGRSVELAQTPKRIVSLVPSQTELLYDLGLEDEVVGITKFCVHPKEWFDNKRRIGGTKNPNIESILALEPDLIIANKEENLEEHIEKLAAKVPVWVSDVTNLDSAVDMIKQVGDLVGKEHEAGQLSTGIQNGFKNIQPKTPLRVAYLIWRNPYMTVGGDTFIGDMLRRCGLVNVFENQKRYPQTLMEEIYSKKTDIILLASEPYPFTQKHINEIQAFLPDIKIQLVDGEMFSWYGSHLLKMPNYCNELTLL